jgi:hypothetical protein
VSVLIGRHRPCVTAKFLTPTLFQGHQVKPVGLPDRGFEFVLRLGAAAISKIDDMHTPGVLVPIAVDEIVSHV